MITLDEAQCGSISRGYCPACNHAGFRLGPRGGVAINIECMSTACRARFNVVPVSGAIIWAHTIDRGSEWPIDLTDVLGTDWPIDLIDIVQGIIALLPNDRAEGLKILDAARRMVERFKR